MNRTVNRLPFHIESRATVNVSVETLFSYLDDHRRLASHMNQSSWMMAGGRMTFEIDAAQGHSVGSKICLHGHALGIPLAVEEIITHYHPPLSKYWETSGPPSYWLSTTRCLSLFLNAGWGTYSEKPMPDGVLSAW